MDIPLFSVVIPTYHRPEDLKKCVSALLPDTQTLDETLYEIIVTDDSKNDDSVSVITSLSEKVKFIKGPQNGPAANRNNGAGASRGHWLVFIDDDCIPDKTLLEGYYRAINENPELNVLEGKIYPDRPKMHDDDEAPVNEKGGFLWSCNFCIRKDIYYALNGFDESFPMAAMEDVDFNYRLKKAGYVPAFISQAAVMHPWRKNTITYAQQLKREASTKLYFAKHPEERNRIGLKFHLDILYKCSLQLMAAVFTLRFTDTQLHIIRIVYALRMSVWLTTHK